MAVMSGIELTCYVAVIADLLPRSLLITSPC